MRNLEYGITRTDVYRQQCICKYLHTYLRGGPEVKVCFFLMDYKLVPWISKRCFRYIRFFRSIRFWKIFPMLHDYHGSLVFVGFFQKTINVLNLDLCIAFTVWIRNVDGIYSLVFRIKWRIFITFFAFQSFLCDENLKLKVTCKR